MILQIHVCAQGDRGNGLSEDVACSKSCAVPSTTHTASFPSQFIQPDRLSVCRGLFLIPNHTPSTTKRFGCSILTHSLFAYTAYPIFNDGVVILLVQEPWSTCLSCCSFLECGQQKLRPGWDERCTREKGDKTRETKYTRQDSVKVFIQACYWHLLFAKTASPAASRVSGCFKRLRAQSLPVSSARSSLMSTTAKM